MIHFYSWGHCTYGNLKGSRIFHAISTTVEMCRVMGNGWSNGTHLKEIALWCRCCLRFPWTFPSDMPNWQALQAKSIASPAYVPTEPWSFGLLGVFFHCQNLNIHIFLKISQWPYIVLHYMQILKIWAIKKKLINCCNELTPHVTHILSLIIIPLIIINICYYSYKDGTKISWKFFLR